MLHTFLSCNFSYPSLSPVTSLITLTNNGPILMDLLLASQNNFKTTPDVGCSKIITTTVNIIVYNSLFQCCNRHKQIPGYLSFVTGFWKTNQNVTLGLFQFIGPANDYTHTLPIHTAIVGLG